MAYVMSANGRTTKGDDPNVHDWSSDEDSQHFIDLRDSADVVVVDRTTYDLMQLEPEAGKLRVVMTHRPEEYASQTVPGQLEFTSEPIADLVKRLDEAGKQQLLMAGGRHVGAEFLAAGLADDVYLTYEPVLFSQGNIMLADEAWLEVSLRLQSVKQLNERGTLLAHYTVDRGEAVA
jgi:dihydrofolate reductase